MCEICLDLNTIILTKEETLVELDEKENDKRNLTGHYIKERLKSGFIYNKFEFYLNLDCKIQMMTYKLPVTDVVFGILKNIRLMNISNRRLTPKKIESPFSKIKVRNKEEAKAPVKVETKLLQTEDTGKMFEMAICLVYGITYDGKYKYSMELAEKLKPRLSKLIDIFPLCRHTAKNKGRYDFTSLTDETKHLSAKSTKKAVGKVSPQVVGQCQPKKFCEVIGIKYTKISDLKQYIQSNIVEIIPLLVNYTFDCPNIYYNDNKNTIRYITLNTPIEWNKYQFKWTCHWSVWNNSSTLKITIKEKEYALLEFQFHTKNRTNMAIRWFYENFLTIFNKENLSIIDF